MIAVEGKYGIKATVLADSINAQGNRFITFEVEYWRGVLAELNTHKMLSKNSFSSRAVPFPKMLKQLTGRPVRFGANQSGMQDKGEDFDALLSFLDMNQYGDDVDVDLTPEEGWERAKDDAIVWAKHFYEAGYHKQVCNRLLEPWQMMKTVISGTEWENFFWLRDHEAADPSLAELARVMNEARNASTPELLQPGDWHLPYVDYYREVIGYTDDDESILGPKVFYIGALQSHTGEVDQNFQVLTLEEAIKVSCARCAAVSYRNEGYGLDKSIEVYDRLVGSDRKHASAFEHCATPIASHLREWSTVDGQDRTMVRNHPYQPFTWEPGITHMDRKGQLWSGNLKGWRQYRKLIKGENYDGKEVN